jgi:hypothetical protein
VSWQVTRPKTRCNDNKLCERPSGSTLSQESRLRYLRIHRTRRQCKRLTQHHLRGSYEWQVCTWNWCMRGLSIPPQRIRIYANAMPHFDIAFNFTSSGLCAISVTTTLSADMTSTPHVYAAAMQPEVSSNGRPPPLPPRNSSFGDAPPPYTEPSIMALSSKDPRSSSTQSLVPDPTVDSTGQRRLLLVYIHGFMGDETSFRSFPAHVHNLVTITLADSHVVHTKLYPRYRSKHSLEIARDHFSEWCV